MFKWLSAKNCVAFGAEMARMVKEMVPSDPALGESKRASKVNYANQKMQKRISQFRQEEILNFYKIARLLNTFKWDLKDAGYDAKLIDALAARLLIGLRGQ